MISKRDSYNDEIPMFCETCKEDYTIEGYTQYAGDGTIVVIPADGEPAGFCPRDIGIYQVDFLKGTANFLPTHDTSYNGGPS